MYASHLTFEKVVGPWPGPFTVETHTADCDTGIADMAGMAVAIGLG